MSFNHWEATAQLIELERRELVKWTVDDDGRRISVTTKDGTVYLVSKMLSEDRERLRFEGYPETITIALSDVSGLRVWWTDTALSVTVPLLIVGSLVGILGILYAAGF